MLHVFRMCVRACVSLGIPCLHPYLPFARAHTHIHIKVVFAIITLIRSRRSWRPWRPQLHHLVYIYLDEASKRVSDTSWVAKVNMTRCQLKTCVVRSEHTHSKLWLATSFHKNNTSPIDMRFVMLLFADERKSRGGGNEILRAKWNSMGDIGDVPLF